MEDQFSFVPKKLILRNINRTWGFKSCTWICLLLLSDVGKGAQREERPVYCKEKRFPVDWKQTAKCCYRGIHWKYYLSKQGTAPSTAIDDIFSKIRNSCLANHLK